MNTKYVVIREMERKENSNTFYLTFITYYTVNVEILTFFFFYLSVVINM